jgi:hypothetical protein
MGTIFGDKAIIICMTRQKSMQGISRVTMSPMELKMHPTLRLQNKPGYCPRLIQLCFANVLWVAFSIPSGSLSLVKYRALFSNNYLCIKTKQGIFFVRVWVFWPRRRRGLNTGEDKRLFGKGVH